MNTSVSIGITAYNEEKAIPRLLNSITNQKIPKNYELSEIIIISSGSTDSTNDIIKDFQKRDHRIILIEESEKRGKPVALNKILKSFKSELLILSGADGFYNNDSLFWMLKSFDDPKVSAVSGRPIPINSKKSIWGYGSHLLWDMHHLMSISYAKKLTGELCAIRSEFVTEVPESEGGDDIYLERSIMRKNGFIKYEPKAIIYIIGPQTAIDYFKQRRRVMGHLKKAEKNSKMKSPTTSYTKILKILILNIKSFFSPYSFPVMVLEFIARIMASWDVKKGNITSNWKMIQTTKDFS